MSAENSIIYATGCTSDGTMLIGGIWRLWHQEGFPLEMAHLVCRDKGWRVDWLEAMADASRSDNLPALMKQVEAFLPSEEILHLKFGFTHVMGLGKSYDQIVSEKRANGRNFEAFINVDRLEASHLPNNEVSGAARRRSL